MKELDPDKERIARRVAREIAPGSLVNLGIGLPTLVANYLPGGLGIFFHTENGLIGVGPMAALHAQAIAEVEGLRIDSCVSRSAGRADCELACRVEASASALVRSAKVDTAAVLCDSASVTSVCAATKRRWNSIAS